MVNVAAPPQVSQSPSPEAIDAAIAKLLVNVEIFEPYHDLALELFNNSNFMGVKLLWLEHPEDGFCKALNFLGGAKRNPAAAPTILGEAMNAIADFKASQYKNTVGPALAHLLQGDAIEH